MNSLHVAHFAQQGYTSIANQTVHTDAVVLAVGHFLSLNIEELWINSGFGKHYRNIAAHAITRCLNESVKDLIMCHA